MANFDIFRKLASGLRGAPARPAGITIGITTFEARFSRYFVPLVTQLRSFDQEREIVVAVNGEHHREFNESFRSDLLRFTAGQPRVFPILFPSFRGLAKLWNTIIVQATEDYVLMLNDDIMIDNPRFLDDVSRAIAKNGGRSFVVNGSWSHFLISRREIDELGYFDERLLGIGEEDGDTTWRYIERYGTPLPSIRIKGFTNYAEESVDSYKPLNIQSRPGMKYSLFNRTFMFETKYERDPKGIRGMFEEPMRLKDAGPSQYPNERFYREKRDEL